MIDYRNSPLSDVSDSFYEADIVRYERPSEIEWEKLDRPGCRYRIIVQENQSRLPLDMLFLPRESRDLLVGLHGAETSEASLPKFQYVRSFESSRQESLLFLSDPTPLLSRDRIHISWYVGDTHTDVSREYSSIVRDLLQRIALDNVTFVGHSAGATAAVKIASRVPGSLAVAVNGQYAANLYPADLEHIRRNAFPECVTIEEMLGVYRDRFSLESALTEPESDFRVIWFTHKDDGSSFGKWPNFPTLLAGMCRGSSNCIAVLCDWEYERSAHALPNSVIPFLQIALRETRLVGSSIAPVKQFAAVGEELL